MPVEEKRIKMLSNVGEYEKDSFVTIDEETAKKWIAAGLAEEAPEQSLQEDVKEFSNELRESIVGELKEAFKPENLNFATPKEHKEKSLKDFLNNYARKNYAYLNDNYEVKGMTVGSEADGGALVPDKFIPDFFKFEGFSPVARAGGVRVYNDPSPLLRLAARDSTLGPTGGFGLVRVDEEESLTDSHAKNYTIKLEPNAFAAITPVSNRLKANPSFDIGAEIISLYQEEVAGFEDEKLLVGTGAGEPLGVLNAAATIVVDRDTTSDIKYDDIVNMQSKMAPRSLKRARWVAHVSTYPKIAALADAGNNTIFVQSASLGMPPSLMGNAIDFVGSTKALGTKGDLFLIDWSNYYLHVSALRIDESMHHKYGNDQHAYRVVLEMDGKPALKGPALTRDGTTTLSSFVVLAT